MPLDCEAAGFRTTHWSVVLDAGQSDSPEARRALGQLCETYWYPLYAYIRRKGYSPAEAEDLTQDFFLRLLQKEAFRGLSREGGRFRSYLLTALNHFLINQWVWQQRQKRGGGQLHFSIDEQTAEARYCCEPTEFATPESLFERRWALTLLDSVLQQLKVEYEASGRSELFAALQPCLSGDRDAIAYFQIAANLEMSEGAVKVAVHRLRRRYGQLLRHEISRTVTTPAEVEDEIRHLIQATRM